MSFINQDNNRPNDIKDSKSQLKSVITGLDFGSSKHGIWETPGKYINVLKYTLRDTFRYESFWIKC